MKFRFKPLAQEPNKPNFSSNRYYAWLFCSKIIFISVLSPFEHIEMIYIAKSYI